MLRSTYLLGLLRRQEASEAQDWDASEYVPAWLIEASEADLRYS